MTAPQQTSNGRPLGGRFGFGELLISLTLLVCWYLALRPAIDPDYGWHIANGRHVFDGTVFSGRDLYSWTATELWVVHQWLFEAVMGFVHDRLGPAGNSLFVASLWTLAVALVAARLRARRFTAVPVVLTLALVFLCTMMSVGVRPQVLELVYLAAVLILADRLRRGGMSSARFTGVSVAVAVLWANTHGSFPLLAVVLVLCGTGELVDGGKHARTFLIAAALSSLAFLANPWGYHIIEFAIQSIRSAPTLSSIDEWKPPRLDTGSLVPFNISALLAAVSAFLFARRWRRQSMAHAGAERPHAADVLLFLALLYLGLQSGRHVMLLGIGSAPLIADVIALLAGASAARVEKRPDPDAGAKSLMNVAAFAAVAIVIIGMGWQVVRPEAQSAALARQYPVHLLEEIRRVSRDPGYMFNEYAWGGFLIGQGITPVFIDGRSELYGDDQLSRYGRIVRLNPGWDAALDALGVRSAVLAAKSPLALALAERGWRTVASDPVGIVLRR
jgi:hypothetical protein